MSKRRTFVVIDWRGGGIRTLLALLNLSILVEAVAQWIMSSKNDRRILFRLLKWRGGLHLLQSVKTALQHNLHY